MITRASPKRAAFLRSYADTTRTLLNISEGRGILRNSVEIAISENYPSKPETVTTTIPVKNDDLDIAHAQAPAGLNVTGWKR